MNTDKKQYIYFFTRQDISPEQQLVQTAHVALKLGNTRKADYESIFVVVGVRNEQALMAVTHFLQHSAIPFEYFAEPDLNDNVTSIATVPLDENERFPLLMFNLLKF